MKEEVDWHAKFVDMRRKCRQANLGAIRNREVIDGLAARYSNEFREKIQLRGELDEIKRKLTDRHFHKRNLVIIKTTTE